MLPQKTEPHKKGLILFKYWYMVHGVKINERQERMYVRGAIVPPMGVQVPGFVLVAAQSIPSKVVSILTQDEWWQIPPAMPTRSQKEECGSTGDVGLTAKIVFSLEGYFCLNYWIRTDKGRIAQIRRDLLRQPLIKKQVTITDPRQDGDDAETLIVQYANAGKLKVKKGSQLYEQMVNRSMTDRDNAVEALKTVLSGYERFPYREYSEIRFM